MAHPKLREVLLNTARDDFPTFYAGASGQETRLMDMAVLLAALFMRMNRTQSSQHSAGNGAEDEESGVAKRMFADLRKDLTKGRTFRKLPALERQKIQRALFDRLP